jgi:hypothetical protein
MIRLPQIYTGNLEYSALMPNPERWVKAADYEAVERDIAVKVKEQFAHIARLQAALTFCRDIATEEYAHQGGNPGAECALRHIMNRAGRELGE